MAAFAWASLISLQAALIAPASAQPPEDLNDLMHALQGVRSVEARYREVVESTLLQQPLSSSGVLTYRAPDQLGKQGDGGDSIRISGDSIRISEGGRERQFAISDHEAIRGFVLAMRATFAGNLSQLEQLYDLNFAPRADGWTLTLSPKERRILSVFEHIEIHGQGNRIDRLEVQEGNGDSRTFYLTDVNVSTGL